ncbi:hypothetical protein COOONC_27592 [Cooperia oncophora]
MDLEEYDDDHMMAHKSVLRMSSTPVNPNSMSKQQVDSVKKWLKKIPSGPAALETDMSSIMAEFDVIKTSSSPGAEAESSDSASSFDMVVQDNLVVQDTTSTHPTLHAPVEKVLSAEFLNTLQQPLSWWLMRIIPKESQKAESSTETVLHESMRSMKRPHSSSDVKRHYEFEDVIDRVRASSNDAWVLGSEPSKKTRTEENYAKEEPSTSEQECEPVTPIPFNEAEFLANLSKLFVCKMQTTSPSDLPPNSDGQDIDLSTVLGWKRVLDRIEQAAPYWLKEQEPAQDCP